MNPTDSSATEDPPAAPDPGHDTALDPRAGLRSGGFLAFLVMQFLGALNDNMFRWLVVPIAQARVGGENTFIALSAGLACFVLPYLLLAYPAGFVADRFAKRSVIVVCKAGEIAIMALGIASIAWSNTALMFAVVALMGAQSALFAPARLGSLPEMLRTESLSKANGVLGLVTVLAATAGGIAGNVLAQVTEAGQTKLWMSASAVLVTALVGWLSSLMIPRIAAADPARQFTVRWARETYGDLRQLAASRPLLRVALGTAFFWSVASLAQLNIDAYGINLLNLERKDIGSLLAVLVAGVGCGSVLAGRWSDGRIELGIVPLGAICMATAASMLFISSSSLAWSCTWLLVLGLGAGLFSVPLAAFLQHRSPRASRGAVLAAVNFTSNAGMLVAAGMFALLQGPFGLNAAGVFLAVGCGTLAVSLYAFLLLPRATLRFGVWLASRLVYRLHVHGRQNLPETGGALLVANHVSFLDGIFLLLSSSRNVRLIARGDDYLRRWPMKWLVRLWGIITIDPRQGRRSIVESLERAQQAIRDGDLVCIFAEGQITRTGQLQPFRRGLLRVVEDTGAPLVPVYLDQLWGSIFSFRGGRALWKRPRHLPYHVSIHFGPALSELDDVQQVRQAIEMLGVAAVEKRQQREQPVCWQALQSCRRRSGRRRLADDDGSWSGAELTAACVLAARRLAEQIDGVDSPRIGVACPPSAAAVVANVAAGLASAAVVNLDVKRSWPQLQQDVERLGVSHLVATRDAAAAAPDGVNVVWIEELVDEAAARRTVRKLAFRLANLLPTFLWRRLQGLRPPDLEAPAVIFDTTLDPHPGAEPLVLSQRQLVATIDSAAQVMHFDRDQSVVSTLPLVEPAAWSLAFWLPLVTGAVTGQTIARDVSVDPSHPLHPTVLLSASGHLRELIAKTPAEVLDQLQAVYCCDELDEEVAREFEQRVHVRPHMIYARAALGGVAAANLPHQKRLGPEYSAFKDGTVGRPLPNCAAQVAADGLLQFLVPASNGQWIDCGDRGRIDDEGFVVLERNEG